MSERHRYAYLHGFASGPRSSKGTKLREALAVHGIDLELPDLNRPSFPQLSQAAMFAALDEMDAGEGADGVTWRFFGSSMGGHLAAWWASERPDRVDRLVLLCPAFDMAARWADIVGAERFREWERDGALSMPDGDGKLQPVHFALVEETRRTPAAPAVKCPVLIVHGVKDTVVPIAVSRQWAAGKANVRLIEVNDDHSLAGSVERIAEASAAFFEGRV
jgi:pimeloyl-ACP methyl ester carboxylesterase